jgi:hypothetical protein
MLKHFGLAAVLLATCAVPAFADDTCQVPPTPTAVDGASATTDAMRAAIKNVNDYQASVEKYKQCVSDYVTAQNSAADKDKKPHDAAMIQSEGDKVTAADASKQKAVDGINASIAAYKAAHAKPAG